MAQNGPQGHQGAAASDDGHSAPPTTVAFSLSSAGPYGNGGSSAGNMDAMDACADKGKSVAAADDGEPNVNTFLEQQVRERRRLMKNLFRSLKDLMPHLPQKTDKLTLMGEAIRYIKALEEKVAMLRRGEASSSSSFSLTAMPQTAQGMATLCSSDAPRGRGGGVPVPPAAPAMPSVLLRFKTWSGRNVVLTAGKDSAYLTVCAPRRPNTLTTVMSVLDNDRMEVITARISSDSVRALFIIFAHVTGIDGAHRSSEELYQRAAAEIILRLSSI